MAQEGRIKLAFQVSGVTYTVSGSYHPPASLRFRLWDMPSEDQREAG